MNGGLPRRYVLPGPVNVTLFGKKICTTIEHHSVIKKSEIMPFAETRMDLKIVKLSEVSHTEKEKYCMTSLICAI